MRKEGQSLSRTAVTDYCASYYSEATCVVLEDEMSVAIAIGDGEVAFD